MPYIAEKQNAVGAGPASHPKSAGLSQRSERSQLFRPTGRLAFAVPGDLATPTGGYSYDRRMIQELRRLRWQVDVLNLGDSFPFPNAAQRASALSTLSGAPKGCPIILDGLAFGALPEAGALRFRTPLIALVHQPLALESGLDSAKADGFHESERAALAAAMHVVVTSEVTGRILIADYSVQSRRISVVRPGTDPVPAARGSTDDIIRLLSVGSVVPGKGYDLLIAALARIVDLPWRLTIAGDRTRNPAAAVRLDADILAYGLGDRVTVLGALPADRIMQLYLASDAFVLASRFEGYGMALAEAISHGLPVVSSRAGAIPDTIPAGSGLLVPPDDVPALAYALRRDQRSSRTTAARQERSRGSGPATQLARVRSAFFRYHRDSRKYFHKLTPLVGFVGCKVAPWHLPSPAQERAS